LAITPPVDRFAHDYLFLDRWSHTSFDLRIYFVGITFTFAAALSLRRAPFQLVTIVSFVLPLPYLIPPSATFSAFEVNPATSVTRYSVYFLPVAACLLTQLLEYSFRYVRRIQPKFQLWLVMISTLLIALLLLINQSRFIQTRANNYRSISEVTCSSERFFAPTPRAFAFLGFEYTYKYVANPIQELFNDFRVKRQPEFRWKAVEAMDLRNLDITCDYSIDFLLQELGARVSGDSQTRLDKIRDSLDFQSETVSRNEIFEVYRLMQMRGET
jgi:hypothetical protein